MINTIKYYYNLDAKNINQVNDDYYFNNYILKLYYKEIDIELYNYLINNNYYVHQIIYNRNNEFITNINNKPYILLKIISSDKISMELLSKYNIHLNNKKIPNWDILWTTKIDYIEKNADNIKDDKIKKTLNYYIGMTENAIILYKSIPLNNDYYLCHLRLDDDYSFYDPLNMIIDYKMRDYAEFIKKDFYLNNIYHYDEINKIVMNNNYNDTMLFFVRMMYPTYFFDAYDNYMKGNTINYNFYDKIVAYEKYLKHIYKIIRKKYNIVIIDWLK